MILSNCIHLIIFIVGNIFNTRMYSEAYFPPSFVIQPPKGDYLYRADSTVSLPCFVKAIPSANYEWIKNGRPIENLVVNQNDGSLRIERAIKENEGSYQCVAYNYLGRAISHICSLKMASISSYFSMGERTIEVSLGSSAILECDRPACYPPPSIQWVNVKEGVKIISFEEDYRRVLDDKGNLHITKIVKEDDGEVYSCISTNTFLRTMKRGADTKIRLKIPAPQTSSSKSPFLLYYSKTEVTVLINSTITLSCIFSRGAVRWFRYTPRKEEIKIEDKIKMIRQGTTLEIVNVTGNDSGKYTCHSASDQSKHSVKFSIQVVEKPSFIEKPNDVTVEVNGSHTFKCLATGDPTPDIKWTWNGQDIGRYMRGNRIRLQNNDLYLSNLTPKDIATLQCNASNIYGYVFTNAFINVWHKKPLLIQAPPKYIKGVLKRNVMIVCNAFSVPMPRIDWRKGSYKLNLDLLEKYKIDTHGNLLIKNLNTDDAGVYDCTATNVYGYVKGESTVVIRESTQIILFSENRRQRISSNTLLDCSAKTDRMELQNLVIEWWKNSEKIKADKSHSASLLKSELKLNNLSPRDSGDYYCNASNNLDWDIRKIEVIVEGTPDPGRDILVDCKRYSVKRLAILSWIEGYDNNADITSHIVDFRTQFELDTWFQITPLNDTTFHKHDPETIPKRNVVLLLLHPYLDYNFRVKSVNRLGTSEPSESTVTKCQLPVELPNVDPSNVFIFGTRPNTLKIIWKPIPYLIHNGPNLTYALTVRCTNCDHIATTYEHQMTIPSWKSHYVTVENFTYDDKSSPIEIYKRYAVRIRSKNSMGLSTALANEYYGYSAEDYPKISPNKALVLEVTDHSVRLQWTVFSANQMSDINGFFRGYRIEWCLNGSSELLCEMKKNYQDEILFKPDEREQLFRLGKSNNIAVDRKKRDIAISSIILGHLYTATLGGLPGMTSIRMWTRIINIQYAGPKSSEILISTKEGTPSPVAEFNIDTVEINYIEIAWAKPLTTNGILIGYDVSVKEIFPDGKGGNIVTTQKIKDADQLRERISNLKSETRYQIYIWPLTKRGRGKEKYLNVQTRAESKESNLIQLKIVRLDANSFNMSITFPEFVQQQLEIPDSGWKFYLQFRLMKNIMWEETEKQYQFWWRVVGNLLSDETYLVRAVVNTKTGSIVTQSRLFKTVLNENNAFSTLRASSTTWFIILLILIFGLLCGIIGLFVWRRNKVLYLRGKPAMMIPQNQLSQQHMPSPMNDRYASFVTYSAPENKTLRYSKETIENDFFDEKYPYFSKTGANLENNSSIFHPPNTNCASIIHHSANRPQSPLSSCNFSPSVHRSSPNNYIPATWTMTKTNPNTTEKPINNSNFLQGHEQVFYQPYEYNNAQNSVSTSFV